VSSNSSLLHGSGPIDPLLECLSFLTRYYGKPFSAQTLSHGLPMEDGRLPLKQFARAAERGGLTAKLTRTSLTEVSELLMPCVLVLKDGRACVALKKLADNKVEVSWPETPDSVEELDLEALEQASAGYLFYVRKRYRFDKRAPQTITSKEGHWFWNTLSLSFPMYRDVLVASFFISLFAVASPLFVMNVYDRVVPNEAIETLWALVVGMLVIVLFDFLLKQMRSNLLDLAAKKSDVLLSSRLFEKVLALRMDAAPKSVGAFAGNIQEFDSIRDFVTSSTISAFVDLPFSIIFIAVIFMVAGPVAIIPVIAILIMVGYSLYVKHRLTSLVEQSGRFAMQKNAHLVEVVSGIESLKVYGAQGQFQQKWEELVGNNAKWGVAAKRYSASVSSVSASVQQLNTVFIVAVGVYLIAEGNISMGGLIAAVMLSARALAPFSQVAMLTTRYNQAKSALTTLDSIMALPEESLDRYLHRPFIQGSVEFDRVGLSYPDTKIPAIEDVSFKIQPGEKVGIIGRIGAGKSTIEKILMGLYQPTSGAVRLDGVDFQQISPADIRQKIACLPQDIQLFYGSIRDNITLGVPHVEDSRVIRAAELAGVSEFTDVEPDGLDRQVGERGKYLSGGQRQSVALARTLLFSPPIMVLDEPTSNMDNLAEARVRQNLKAAIKDKTFLLITHKMSMLELVDRVIVIDRGRVVADGPKQDVLEQLKKGAVRAR